LMCKIAFGSSFKFRSKQQGIGALVACGRVHFEEAVYNDPGVAEQQKTRRRKLKYVLTRCSAIRGGRGCVNEVSSL